MTTTHNRPLQKTTWAQKVAKGHEFFKKNIDALISISSFGDASMSNQRTADKQLLYEVYNSRFPSSWFTHILDPFSAQNPNHKKWPAKMRPANILSPNINLLHGEYPGRPFKFTITVKGDTGYNSFVESKKKHLYDNLSQAFINGVNEFAAQNESPELDTGVDTKPVDMPEQVMEKFVNDYRDTLASQAQIDLDLILEDQKVKEKLLDAFKDYLIAGETYSYKDVIRDKTIYEHVSPLEIDYDKSPHVKYIEDGDWVVRRLMMTVSDIVDRFYDSLTPAQIDELELGKHAASPQYFADYLRSFANDSGKTPVYHVVWKSLKKIYEVSYPDPITGETQTRIEDDTFKANPELGEEATPYWVTQVLEGYRIGESLYLEMKPVNYQPNQLHNLSMHKLPYNGRRFSDTHSENTSILKLGIPFQVMYCILFFTLEKTIAKSRGKVVMLDSNVIPRQEGWSEEKFFWYSEAQGYMLINRNQVGVDKSMNQYTVLDLGLFEHIAEIIKVMEFCKQQYDDQLGITASRKGQVRASDSATGTNTSVNQSSVITEMIYTTFDQFVRTDLEGLINCSQISNINGKKTTYTSSDQRVHLLDINPDYYCYADMGIMMSDSAQEREQLARIRQYAQAFAQNGESPDAVIAVETANNISQLKNLLKEIGARQAKLAEQNAASEQERAIERIEVEKQFEEYLALLDIQKMHEEYDRKDNLVITQGNINMAIEAGTAGAQSGTVDAAAYANERDKAAEESRLKEKEIDRKAAADKRANALKTLELKNKNREIAMKQKVAEAQLKLKRSAAKKK